MLLEIAQLLASVATAVGVAFAGMQFFADRRARKAAFTMERFEQLRTHVSRLWETTSIANQKNDPSLPPAEFRKVWGSSEREIERRASDEVFVFWVMLEANQLDENLLTKLETHMMVTGAIDRLEPFLLHPGWNSNVNGTAQGLKSLRQRIDRLNRKSVKSETESSSVQSR